jgi:saccharopine dehydrogenase (NADP+, L-glutamate forming)
MNVLVLGAGLVARPLVRYLSGLAWNVTVADVAPGKAELLIEGLDHCRALQVPVTDAALDGLVPEHDCVVSLLPAPLHPTVAKVCIRHGRSMVTASYISPEMKALDRAAKDAGVTLMNELGLDPGIDHMSAMATIHEVQGRGGDVVSFRSWCGGLPAPDSDDNPLHYKFSWSPMGVLTAATNDARYLDDRRVIDVPGPELFTHFRTVEVAGAGAFEGYPNRDSVAYREVYGLSEARSLLRGTLRYPGHCDSWKKMVDLGMFGRDALDLRGMTYASFTRKVLLDGKGGDMPTAIAEKLGISADDPMIAKIDWLGMFEDEPIPRDSGAPIEVLADRMWERMQFGPGERDMIVLQHTFEADIPGEGRERIVSTLVAYGEPDGDTAMARTVALPAAIGVRLILEGRITARGVISPVKPELYEPIMSELAEAGIVFEEAVTPVA